jgi:hypothetical protein
MTIPVSRETLGYRGNEGCIAYGLGREVLSSQAATVTLTTAQAGALVLFDSAAGHVFTLPAPSTATLGMFFDFAVKTSVTSNAHKIITDSASTFLVGAVVMASIATASPGGFSANGTTIRALSANGTTTGGLIGETYRVVCISATQWQISGVCVGSGTLATPFATS